MSVGRREKVKKREEDGGAARGCFGRGCEWSGVVEETTTTVACVSQEGAGRPLREVGGGKIVCDSTSRVT